MGNYSCYIKGFFALAICITFSQTVCSQQILRTLTEPNIVVGPFGTESTSFGWSVATAGDVNGDGYSDVIIGAPTYSTATELNIGRAYIYYGGNPMDTIPDVTLTGWDGGDKFGSSVSTAGDVNGDGYADVIVGAPYWYHNAGSAYIYYGGPSINNFPNVILQGETQFSFFGGSVSTAGDVNGDGYADVIVGAEEYGSYTGRAYIYLGGKTMHFAPDVTFTGVNADDGFGQSVSTAGDVNGDGYADVIVGAEGYNSSTGRAYIYYGGNTMDTIPNVTLTGEQKGNGFGCSVSTAGDVNGDGYADVIVGAYGFNTAYIYYGGSSMDNVPDVTLSGDAKFYFFGFSVSTAGDLNKDGYADVIVGAPDYNPITSTFGTGHAYIYYGGTLMDNIPDVTLTGEGTHNYFGQSVSAAGDVNKDGFADVIVGDGFYSPSGKVYIYSDTSAHLTALKSEMTVAVRYNLSQNYPNPFNPTTMINYSVPTSILVTIKVFDILGREIATLVNEQKRPGNYEVQFNGSRYASGVYFYRMQAGDFVQDKKLVLVK